MPLQQITDQQINKKILLIRIFGYLSAAFLVSGVCCILVITGLVHSTVLQVAGTPFLAGVIWGLPVFIIGAAVSWQNYKTLKQINIATAHLKQLAILSIFAAAAIPLFYIAALVSWVVTGD